MKTEKDKEMDDLFKRGLEHTDTHSTHMEGDWEAMEQMLDERKRRPMIIYWLPILGSVAAVVLLAIGWWLLKPVVTTQNQKSQRVAIHQPKVKAGDQGEKQQLTAGNNKNIKNNNNSKIDTITPPENIQPGTTNTAVAKNANKVKHNRNYDGSGSPALQSNPGFKGNYASNKPATLELTQQGAAIRPNSGDLVAYSTTAIIGGTQFSDGTIKPANVLPQVDVSKTLTAATIKKKTTSNAYRPQFALTVLASSDKNGVNSFQQTKPGNNAGVLFSVGVSKRFTISTGAVYSAKQYLSDFASYHTNYHFQTNPTSVLADCKMFDIPLNIDYKIFNTYRNKISIGTGLSSYLMLHESYQFNYTGYADGPARYNVSNPDKYLLSIVNFQATYERQINSNVGITLQPYMKLPLSAVGASQVRLQSTGLAVGLTWNLKTSSTP